MSDLTDTAIGGLIATLISIFCLFLLMGFGFSACSLYAKYNVWASSKNGESQLAEADWNRQIAVREAKAKEESALLLAQAEIIRAKGVAKANQIIGQSLNNNESYLRYLWIENLANEHNQVIYVPTEANLPILESKRLVKINKIRQ